MKAVAREGKMIDEELRKQILNSISHTGSSASDIKIIIGSKSNNINQILDLGSGFPRINRSVINKFKLILNQPDKLLSFDRLETRCCFCNKVIGFPCWYYSIKYAVNHFHYFVCFDASRPNNPTTKCYRRE